MANDDLMEDSWPNSRRAGSVAGLAPAFDAIIRKQGSSKYVIKQQMFVDPCVCVLFKFEPVYITSKFVQATTNQRHAEEDSFHRKPNMRQNQLKPNEENRLKPENCLIYGHGDESICAD
ncbi:hypothetical protein GWI33_012508 [Rhynchophorus ferrugineus]|uniref:Uncharacterized protein n=1 Tax=Rhynchophorus ferrugineus TaxID=354439 RepID=A0A834I6D6_RHYFE|nr:hypothetical protein GWI33_012508 [Rhynchophorus ferrugineus]